ncbi:hypothetical protein J1614_000837 [Plenodomus biglobosus]|nr:hypothetical protein J1614_000837 [Plenodomus biglobosus]
MPLNNLRMPPTGSNLAPHAHPLPGNSVPPDDAMQRLEDMAASLPLHVQLHGLAAEEQSDAHNAYRPRVRRSASTSQAIEHVDIVTCWKGLSYSQASELTFWKHAFRICLSSQIERALRSIIVAQMGEQPNPLEGLSLLVELNERLAVMGSHVVSVDTDGLINSMMSLFYEGNHLRTERLFGWGISSENLPRFLRNFIRTQDCFMHDADEPTVLVDGITYDYKYPVFNITVELAWFPPKINFDGVPLCVKPQEEYCIVPVYVQSASLFDTSTSEPYPDCFRFTVTQSSSEAQWDGIAGCFRMTAETYITVNVATSFPGNVQFKRCSRFRIVVNVTPTDASSDTVSSEASHRQSSQSPVTKPGVPSHFSGLFSKTCPINSEFLEQKLHRHALHYLDSVAGNLVAYADPQSLFNQNIITLCRKRKAQLPKSDSGDTFVDPSLGTESLHCDMGSDARKRRRVGSTGDDPDVEERRDSPSRGSEIVQGDLASPAMLQAECLSELPTTLHFVANSSAPDVQAGPSSRVAQHYGIPYQSHDGHGGLNSSTHSHVFEGPSRGSSSYARRPDLDNHCHACGARYIDPNVNHRFGAPRFHVAPDMVKFLCDCARLREQRPVNGGEASHGHEAPHGLGLEAFHELQMHDSGSSTVSGSGQYTPDSAGSPSLIPNVSTDSNVDHVMSSLDTRDRRDSMEPELRHPASRPGERDIPQEQILQNFRELLQNPQGLQHNDDFIDVFTDTEAEDDEELSDDGGSSDEMEGICSED